MHNKKDNIVPWNQALELFTGLRRLGKKTWMLQYDNGSHVLSNSVDQLDYHFRLSQFFDHYLKGYPPPKWMTQGTPTSFNQIDERYELDLEGYCGKDCKICQEKNTIRKRLIEEPCRT